MDEEYVPGDRSGYTLTVHNADDPNAQTYTVVERENGGVGLGSFAAEPDVDRAIEQDRAYLANLAARQAEADAAADAERRAQAADAGVPAAGQPLPTRPTDVTEVHSGAVSNVREVLG